MKVRTPRSKKTKPLPPAMTFALDNILAIRNLEKDIEDTIRDNHPDPTERWPSEKIDYLCEQVIAVVNEHLEKIR